MHRQRKWMQKVKVNMLTQRSVDKQLEVLELKKMIHKSLQTETSKKEVRSWLCFPLYVRGQFGWKERQMQKHSAHIMCKHLSTLTKYSMSS